MSAPRRRRAPRDSRVGTAKRVDVAAADAPLAPRGARASGQATIADVARFAGVSTSTVSRVLRQPAIVSELLRRKVREAVERLDYVPNQMATGLAAAQGRQIGVIVPSILNAFFSATVDALTERLGANGQQVLLGTTDYDEAREEALIESFVAWQPAAVVVTGLRHARRAARLLLAARAPVIEMWEIGESPIDYAVGFSHRGVGRAQARHLLAAGRRRIAFLGAYLDRDQRAATRAEGYAERSARPAARRSSSRWTRRSSTGAGAAGHLRACSPSIPKSMRCAARTTSWRWARCSRRSAAPSRCQGAWRSLASATSTLLPRPCRR